MLNIKTYIEHIVSETVNKKKNSATIEKIRAPKDRSAPFKKYNYDIDLVCKPVGEYIYLDDLLINEGVNKIHLNLRPLQRRAKNIKETLEGDNRKVSDFINFLSGAYDEHSMYVQSLRVDDEDNLTINLSTTTGF